MSTTYDARQTIQDFIAAHGLTMTAEPAASNPNMDDPMPGASHWLCILTSEHGSKLPVPFSQGSAHRRWKAKPLYGFSRVTPKDWQRFGYKKGGPANFTPKTVFDKEVYDALTEPTAPDLANVLDCLRSDASSIDDARSFEDWASNFGYDTDSRKAEKTYRACQDSAQALRHLLGRKAYDELMECEGL